MLLVRTSKASLQGMLRDLTLACPNYIIHTSILSMRRSKNAGAKRPGSIIRELTYLMRYFYESRCGIEGKDFNRAWHLDPEEPQIANLMSVYEKDVYQKIAVSNRACAVQSEINMLVGELSEEVLHQERARHRSKRDCLFISCNSVLGDDYANFTWNYFYVRYGFTSSVDVYIGDFKTIY